MSASTGNVVHVLRVRTARRSARFASGGSPHESVYIDGGKRILHASIGTVYSPLDEPRIPDPLKGERVCQIVNAKTFKIERRYNLRKALDARGLTDVSTAVRPMTLSPDEKTIYFQVSFFHGYVEMDRADRQDHRVNRLPNLVPNTPREQYLLDSAHHGIAMNPTDQDLRRRHHVGLRGGRRHEDVATARPLIKGGKKPYWVTPSVERQALPDLLDRHRHGLQDLLPDRARS